MTFLFVKKDETEIKLVDKEYVDQALSAKLDETDTFSGDYNDLDNKPTIPNVVNTVANNNQNPVTSNAVYQAINNHTHTTNDITNFENEVDVLIVRALNSISNSIRTYGE